MVWVSDGIPLACRPTIAAKEFTRLGLLPDNATVNNWLESDLLKQLCGRAPHVWFNVHLAKTRNRHPTSYLSSTSWLKNTLNCSYRQLLSRLIMIYMKRTFVEWYDRQLLSRLIMICIKSTFVNFKWNHIRQRLWLGCASKQRTYTNTVLFQYRHFVFVLFCYFYGMSMPSL